MNTSTHRSLWLGLATTLILGLSACKESAIVTQPTPAAPNTPAPTFTAESFSTKNLTITEGKDYTKLAKPQAVPAGKSQVIEFFWYGCPHCYAIEPAVQAWKKTLPASVSFTRYHPQWNDAMQAHQRMAMAVQSLGKSDELDGKIFHALHEQGKSLTSEESIAEFMAQNGVDKATWSKAYRGFDTNAAIAASDNLFQSYELKGVPDFIVNGKYLVQGENAHTLQVVNKLLEQK